MDGQWEKSKARAVGLGHYYIGLGWASGLRDTHPTCAPSPQGVMDWKLSPTCNEGEKMTDMPYAL